MATFPRQPEEVTATWLTEQLHASGALGQGRVVDFRCEPLHPHRGMTGVLVRLRLAYGGSAADAPSTLVAKFSSPDPGLRGLVHSLGFVERECRFYRQLAAATPVRTPRCHAAEFDLADGTSVLLLEDLAPAGHGDWLDGADVDELRLVLTSIAAVHAAWWESPRLAGEDWLDPRGPLVVANLGEVVAATWEAFLSRLSVPVTAAIEQTGALLHEHLQAVAGHLLTTSPRTLVHQDLDGPNLFFPEADGVRSVVVIDWQAATRARAAVDVAWLLSGSCEPERRRATERQLLACYHDRLGALGVTGYPAERLWDDYRLALLLPAARLAAAVGSQDGPRGGFWDVVFPRYAQAICDLEVGELLAADAWVTTGAKESGKK